MKSLKRLQAGSIFVLILFFFPASSCDSLYTDGLKTSKIRINDVPVTVELAVRPEDRRQGLMYRAHLKPDHGMLFVFEKPAIQSFWMKNTLIPLDVGFFDAQGFLIESFTMEVDQGKRTYTSSEPARYALEVNAGWFRKHGLRKFARIHLPSHLRDL